MINEPLQFGSEVSEAHKPKRLLIVEDDPEQLARFTKQYEAMKYEVTGVLVAHRFDDALFINGRIRQTLTKDEKAALEVTPPHAQDHPVKLPRTVKSALCDAMQSAHSEYKNSREDSAVRRYEAMAHIEHGVKSKSELRQIMAKLGPFDAVLSDYELRIPKFTDDRGAEEKNADNDVIHGTDSMAIAKDLWPDAPRVIHSTQYTRYSDEPKENWAKNEERLSRANHEGQAQGYRVFAKDHESENVTAEAVDAYFKEQFVRSRGMARV